MLLSMLLSGGASNTNQATSLGGTKSSSPAPTKLFGDIPQASFTAGSTRYRLVYIQADVALSSLRVFKHTETPSANTTISLAWSVAAAGGTEPAIANESTAPAGVVFSDAVDINGAINAGALAANQARGLWIRYRINSGTTVIPLESFVLAFDVVEVSGTIPPGANESIVMFGGAFRTVDTDFFASSNWGGPYDTNSLQLPGGSYGHDRYRSSSGGRNRAKDLTYLANGTVPYSDYDLWVTSEAARGAKVWFQGYMNIHGSATSLTQGQWDNVRVKFQEWLTNNAGRCRVVLISNEPVFSVQNTTPVESLPVMVPADAAGVEVLTIAVNGVADGSAAIDWPSGSAALYAQYVRIIKQCIANSATPNIEVWGPEVSSLDPARRADVISALNTSAAGPNVGFGDGAGTTLKDWVDVITFHEHHPAGGWYNLTDGGFSLIQAFKSELSANGWNGPIAATDWMQTIDRTLPDGSNMRDSALNVILEHMARHQAACCAAGARHQCLSEVGSDELYSFFNNNDSNGDLQRLWWTSYTNWWKTSPIGRIALLTDGRIRVTRADGQILLIPTDLTNGKFGILPTNPIAPPPPAPPGVEVLSVLVSAAATVIFDAQEFASASITAASGNTDQDRYIRGGPFNTALFATNSIYQWWERAVVGSGLPQPGATYAETSFKTVMGRGGSNLRVMSASIKADSPGTAVEQIRLTEYQTQGLPGAGRVEPVFYQRMWVKFDERELSRAQRVGSANFYHMFWEVRCEPDYRLRLQLQYDGTKLYWVAFDDRLSDATPIHMSFTKTVNVTLAPHSSAAGWHRVEIYLNRPQGVWRAAVDGIDIINLSLGINSLLGVSGNIANYPAFTQNYCASSVNAQFTQDAPAEILFSGLKLWDRPPIDAWQAGVTF